MRFFTKKFSAKQVDDALIVSWPIILISGKKIKTATHETKSKFLSELFVSSIVLIAALFLFGFVTGYIFSLCWVVLLSIRWRRILSKST